MRKRGRTDANQTKVVEHLRRAGLSVAITSMVGNGFPDLVVAGRGKLPGWSRTILVELKDPDQPTSKRKLTGAEIKFIDTWQGEYIKATTAEEILKLFGK
jgi:hypothetical protein